MSVRLNILKAAAVAPMLCGAISAQAKSVTIGNIALDVPDSFQTSESSRGVEVQTSDQGVMIWFETYMGSEADDLVSEHDKYWKKNDVSWTNEPVHQEITQASGAKQESFDYKDATWQGKPTILRYICIGPLGSENTMILVTFWASPKDWDQYSGDINRMIQTLDVTYKK